VFVYCCLSIDMVSLVPVGVAKLRCYVVSLDDYPSIQDVSSSWVNPLELLDTLYLAKMLAICLRYALTTITNRIWIVVFINSYALFLSTVECSKLVSTAHWRKVLAQNFAFKATDILVPYHLHNDLFIQYVSII